MGIIQYLSSIHNEKRILTFMKKKKQKKNIELQYRFVKYYSYVIKYIYGLFKHLLFLTSSPFLISCIFRYILGKQSAHHLRGKKNNFHLWKCVILF